MTNTAVGIVPAKWVKGSMLMPLFGLSSGAADKKRLRGEWESDRHYRKAPDGNYVYNWKEIEAWYEGII